MAENVKDIMACIGRDTSGGLSVLRHLFGFTRRRVPTDPDNTVRAEVSMLSAIRGVKNRHIHVDIIAVGWWNEFSDTDSDTGREKLDYAVYRTRNIYDQVNLGVGRVDYFVLDQDEAGGADDIDDRDEAEDLIDDWNAGLGNAIDCFVPRTISASFIGVAPSKHDGVIAAAIDAGGSVSMNFDGFSRTFAHEIGHFLDLNHNHDGGDDCENCPGASASDNLMAQTRCANCQGQGVRLAVNLTGNQGSTMRDHDIVQNGC